MSAWARLCGPIGLAAFLTATVVSPGHFADLRRDGASGLFAGLPAHARTVTIGGWDSTVNSWKGNRSVSRHTLIVHKSDVIQLNAPFAEALIANDKIADVLPLTDQSIYIVGKGIGSTTLAILDDRKKVMEFYEIEVTHDLDDLRTKLAQHIPTGDIRVAAANGRILLSGTVPDAFAADNAVAIASQYAPDAVTNAMQVRATQQVMLEVRFVEANRSASRELGLGLRVRNQNNLAIDTGNQGTIIGDALAVAPTILSGTQPFGSMVARLLENGTNADLIIQALEAKNLARRLAEPNLITMSGETASFLAGGEFPFPIDAGDDQITIQFKRFGVSLEFTPTVLPDGNINLKIVPEVSELDQNAGVNIRGTQIPGLVVRRADTTVELRDGQGFAIAGLLQHTLLKNKAQLPWIGSVPILGALFRSAEYQRSETDLVIIVTPRLVRPTVVGEQLKTPLDGSEPTNDPEFFIGGQEEEHATVTSYRGIEHFRQDRTAPYGHILHLTEGE